MQIILTEDEIRGAVDTYVRSQINIADNQDIKVDFTAGRGPNGLSATLDIRAKVVAPAPKKPGIRAVETPKTSVPYAPGPRQAVAEIPAPEPTVVEEAPEAQPEAPADDEPEVANISTGGERIDPETLEDVAPEAAAAEDEVPAGGMVKANPFKRAADKAAADTPAEEAAPAPAKKSIFSRAAG